MGTQISIFDGAQRFIIDKPVRLIECFAGYGSQALSLKYLGIPFEHHRIAEWAVKSIQAYKDMHFPDDTTDYSDGKNYEEVVDYLFTRGISADYNKPMTREQILRMGEGKCRTVYNNIHATHNLVSVCNVTAYDLQIKDTDKFTYLLTYSFPCQDLSNAGLGKGMQRGSGTRSGLLWEIERILKECDELPQVLMMENVPEVIGQKNRAAFGEWIAFLDSMGYKSKWEILNGTDFGMPQNRKRCFMISVLGDYYYELPQKTGCRLRLKDLLEENVSEEYYLSDNILKYFIKHTKESEEKGNGFRFEPTDGDCIAKRVTTRAGGRMDDNFIRDKIHSVVKLPHGYFEGSIERDPQYSPTIDTGVGNWHTLIGEENVTQCDCMGYIDKDGFNEMTGRVYGTDAASPIVRTFCGGGQEIKVAVPTSDQGGALSAEPLAYDEQNGYIRKDGFVGTLTTDGSSPKHNNRVVEFMPNMRVRKLTPRECFRLMGVNDTDYDRVAKNQSKSSLYHLAGDSIITNCLMALFGTMFNC